MVARGALYGAAVDAAIKKASGGKHTFEDVVRALYAKASASHAPLPTSAWIDAVRAEIGDRAAADFDDAIEHGRAPKLADDMLGPCFTGAPRRYQAFDLGFDAGRTRAHEPKTIVGLVASGPASRAGLVEGDVLVEAAYTPGSPAVPARIVVERAGERRTISYLPGGAIAEGRGFVRKRDVPDESCVK
jgi:predicted metalloprotease with PDZ domain